MHRHPLIIPLSMMVGKLKFDTPADEDVQEEAVTFTARNIMTIVASYIDGKGIERIPRLSLWYLLIRLRT